MFLAPEQNCHHSEIAWLKMIGFAQGFIQVKEICLSPEVYFSAKYRFS
jgi:hypothetical protein